MPCGFFVSLEGEEEEEVLVITHTHTYIRRLSPCPWQCAEQSSGQGDRYRRSPQV